MSASPAAFGETDTGGFRGYSLHPKTWFLLGLAVLLLLVAMAALGSGAVSLSFGQVLAIFAAELGGSLPWEFGSGDAAVLWHIRLPRVLLAIGVGASLAVCGAAMQGLFRNPLADPGLIGVSSGSALAAVTVIVLGSYWPVLNTIVPTEFVLPVAAFLGGIVTTLLVYRLSAGDGRTNVATLLLAGIAINAIAGALTGLLTYVADDQQLRSLTFWSMGSLGGATWAQLTATLPFLLLSVLIIPRYARALNVFLLGEAEAGHLGFDVERIKRQLVVLVALAIGAGVAAAGIIGFVSLVVPHLLRLSIGPDHRWLLPGSALLGASLLLAADMFARTVVSPAELPIGIITAVLGGPFFLWLLIRYRSRIVL